jgi:hypothetical protein
VVHSDLPRTEKNNLPDAHIGYAVMDIDGDRIGIQSFVR